MISPDHLRQMTSDQVPAACKTEDSFFPGFWDGTVGILLTQVEMGKEISSLVAEFQALHEQS